jgi:cytochrome c nitrite reductase small subunit
VGKTHVKGGDTVKKNPTFRLVALGFVAAVIIMVLGANIYAYTNNPEFCGGCHAMTEHYKTWQSATHKSVACAECHLPHDNPASYLGAKIYTGVVDSNAQVVRNYPLAEDIKLTEKGRDYLQNNCLRCHDAAVANIMNDDTDCLSCHRSLVHEI